MIEHAILKLFIISREYYNKYYSFINIKYIKDNYKDIYKLFLCVDKFYTDNPDIQCFSIEGMEATMLSQYPMMKNAERLLLSSLLAKISDVTLDFSNVYDYLTTHRNRAIAGELAIVALDVSEGRKSLAAIDDILAKLETVKANQESAYVTSDLFELYDSQSHHAGLRWRLKWLNQSLGSLRKGDFGFLFARPETGKTTFLASEITHFASQTDRPILWCNNEEGGKKVMLRCYQAALGVTTKELFDDLQTNKEKYTEITHDNIRLYDEAAMTRHTIEQRCKELQPSLIVLDQIDKIKGFVADRYDLQMKAIYQWARELAKTYCPVIAVCQAGGTADGKKWLTMNDVDSSHTAKQGEADFILGIGKSFEEGMQGIRFINISKNKLIGDDDTLPDLRHGKAEVVINADIARYEDLV